PKRLLKRAPLKTGEPGPQGPLILYADTWPTREVINLKEIQGATTETDHALGAKAVASDLALAFDELGIVAEAQRLDDLPEDADLLTGRPIVLVYPVRHEQAPAVVQRFVDQRLEGLVAEQDPRLKKLTLCDVAIAEKSTQAEHAQAALSATMRYYGLTYRPGIALLEPMKSIEIYEHLRTMAKQVPK
ncbi:MAG TPA: hypothetical protein VHX44_15555, partial [Planctomycetota bacterium]|nr:hypothetical protein [Planctomycetota bacterium]